MIRAVVWKELQEQGLIAIMLAVLGSGLLIAAAMLADPPTPGAPPSDIVASLGAGRMLALMLVVTAGMVCGGALFAAEKEAGTMLFLEALPTSRWTLWRAKLAAGLVLAGVEVAVLLGVATILRLADGPFLIRLVVYGVLAFSWGMLGSTLARTTLGSVGIAIPAASLAMFLFLLPIMVFFSSTGTGVPRATGWLIFEILMLITPLALSAWRFTALDRLRAAEAFERATAEIQTEAKLQGRQAGLGIGALIWLTLRQMRVTALILSMFATAFGCSLLLPELRPVFIWPFLALAAGVLAGLTAFSDEQSHRTALFWGEQRLPISRAWSVKIAIHLGLLAWLLFLIALPCIIRAQIPSSNRFAFGQTSLAAVFQSRLFDEIGSQGWKYLLMPAVYGFAFGHLCGLLFRKLVVACGVAMMLGGVVAVVWGPSLLAGGLRHWQAWGPAALVLLTGLSLMRLWGADRANSRQAALRLAGGMTAMVLLLGVGLLFRIVQIPDETDSADDVDYVATLPNYETNVGGREFRMASERFARVAANTPEIMQPGDQTRRGRIEERLDAVVRSGWPKDDPALDSWLNTVYEKTADGTDEKPWPELAASAAAQPGGVFDPPQMVTTMVSTTTALDNARKMAVAILARSLQLQVSGDQAAFLSAFKTVLQLAHTVRNGGGFLALETSLDIERAALMASDRWLERLPTGYVEQTRALARLMEENDQLQLELRPHLLADRFVVRGMMQAPSQWLSLALTTQNTPPEQTAAEADLVSVAWTVPWERERTRRLIGLPNEAIRPDSSGYLTGRPGGAILQGRTRAVGELTDRELLLRTARRSLLLKCAVRTYLSERKTPPATQDELVKGGYIRQVPEDPYGEGRPFGYRVSKGENLIGPPRFGPPIGPQAKQSVMTVNAGQVIIWSVGQDRVDQGGIVPPGGPRAEDLVFVVPEPAQPAP